MSLPSWITEPDKASANRVAKSAAITISSGAVRFLGSFVTAIVLGRLLSPDDFGLIGMVMPIIAFVTILADGGVSNYTLQSKHLDQQQLSLTFVVGAVIAVLLFLILAAVSPLVAMLYGDDRLSILTVVVASSLIISIFNTQHNALVKRCFMHNYYAVAEIVGSLASMAIGIALALSGAGYWALASVPLVRHLTHAAVIWYLSGWVPTYPTIDVKQIKEILSFGGYVIFSTAIMAACRNLDKVILGLKYNAQEVGFYAMAYNIMMLPFLQILSPAGGAIVPYFSQIKEDKQELTRAIIKVASYLGYIIAPLMAFAAANAEELLVFILGSQWKPSAPIFSLLAFASITISLAIPLNWAMVASGQPSKLAQWSAITALPMVACYFIGAPWGGYGVASGYLAFTCLNLVALPIYCSRFLEFGVLSFLVMVLKVLLIAGVVTVSQHYLGLYIASAYKLSPWFSLCLKLLGLTCTLAALLPIFARGMVTDVRKILEMRRK